MWGEFGWERAKDLDIYLYEERAYEGNQTSD